MGKVIRLSLDTEFNEEVSLGHSSITDEISYALVNIDQPISLDPLTNIGFYAVAEEFNRQAAEQFAFTREHVLPKLFIDCFADDRPMPKSDIAEGVKEYLREQKRQNPDADVIELWALNKITDIYLFTKLFGSQMKMKAFAQSIGIRKIMDRDLKEFRHLEPYITVPKPQLNTSKYHNSFYDACYQGAVVQWFETNFPKGQGGEVSSMQAWMALPQDDPRKAGFVATGMPLPDPSSQFKPPIPKDVDDPLLGV
jgi:hypothetical protein